MDYNEKYYQNGLYTVPERETSMGSQIMWNVSKAMEKNPHINLKSALTAAQERLNRVSRDASAIISRFPEERHMECALLAWHQLGHNDAVSLYSFIETRRNESCYRNDSKVPAKQTSFINKESRISKDLTNSDVYPLTSPFIPLPIEKQLKLVMRSENATTTTVPGSSVEKEVIVNVIETCCADTGCIKRLTALESATDDLRVRAQRLARREAQRVELLERAEATWKDLEIGYQQRLQLAEEKEKDMARETKRLIEERNGYKDICTTLAKHLKENGEAGEKKRDKLTEVEKKVWDSAAERLRLSEEVEQTSTALIKEQCGALQFDRDLQFKVDQASRKLVSLKGEMEALSRLSEETHRALRAELGGLLVQTEDVSALLLGEEDDNDLIKAELDELLKEKNEIVQDMTTCMVMCDKDTQSQMDKLRKKREELAELKKRVVDCRCKEPTDSGIEVKRTASLAGLCQCAPDDRLLTESCSCVSLRSRMLSSLLENLFNGLQSELGFTGSIMPCHLLKCLEDRHNWDRGSVVKANLRNYFSDLLLGELKISIATSIEKYHAKWVDANCADMPRLTCPCGMEDEMEDVMEGEDWEKQALNKRAQKLANEIAEKMFEDRAEELANQLLAGRTRCKCKEMHTLQQSGTEVFSCLVEQPLKRNYLGSTSSGVASPSYWRRTLDDVTQLKAQIEDIKKESIKKEDLNLMEEKIVKLVQRVSRYNNMEVVSPKTQVKNRFEKSEPARFNTFNRKQLNEQQFVTSPKFANKYLNNQRETIAKPTRKPIYRRPEQSFAVNLCLLDPQMDPNKLSQEEKIVVNNNLSQVSKTTWKPESVEELIPQISSIKQSEPNMQLTAPEITIPNKSETLKQTACPRGCVCLHKIPSKTSIDKLLNTLRKWKYDLTDRLYEQCNKEVQKTDSLKVIDLCDTTKVFRVDSIKPESKVMKQVSKHKNKSINTMTGKSNTEAIISDNFSSQINENVTIITEFEHQIMGPSESEYMGAINLEKSNERFSKCIINGVKESIKNNKQKSNLSVKCLASYNNENKSLKIQKKDRNTQILQTEPQVKTDMNCLKLNSEEPHKDDYHHIKIDNTDQKQMSSTLPINLIAISYSDQNKNAVSIVDNHVNVTKDQELNATKSKFVAISNMPIPNDFDYQVKFLGATVANPFPKTEIKKKIYGHTTNQVKDDNISILMSTTADRSNHHTGICECNVKFDEFKKIINNAFYKQHGDYNAKEDKSTTFSTVSAVIGKQNISEKQEPCVCCNKEETCDLEVNTFNLLEVYLKEKLEEFKRNNNSHVLPGEENKLFATILQKIKQVITNGTNKIICQCSEGYHTENSWNRASCLLQEYLKSKVKRVQCMSVSAKEGKTTIIPNVTHEICNLIENDFQRIKDICKCQNERSVPMKTHLYEQTKFEVPVKDTNIVKSIGKDSVQNCIKSSVTNKLSKQISNTPIILKQTVSLQVAPDFKMETKSCDAVGKANKTLQTVERQEKVTSQCPPSSETCQEHSLNVIDMNEQETHKNIDLAENDLTSQRAANLSYIGYTVDCSCDRSLGSCICSKSIVKENNLKIDKMWNTFTKKNAFNTNLSYIMENIYQKHDTTNLVKVVEESLLCLPNPECTYQLCDLEGNIQDKENLVTTINDRFFEPTKAKASSAFDVDMAYLENNQYPNAQLDRVECESQSTQEPRSNYVRFAVDSNVDSEAFVDKNTRNIPKLPVFQNCDCDSVPICHVKMLIENIESRLVNCTCTCDSLTSKVCPVHSKKTR